MEHREGNLVVASSVVLTSNRGGYAANGYFIYEEPGTGRTSGSLIRSRSSNGRSASRPCRFPT